LRGDVYVSVVDKFLQRETFYAGVGSIASRFSLVTGGHAEPE